MDGSMHGWVDSRMGKGVKTVNLKPQGSFSLVKIKSSKKETGSLGMSPGIRLG